MKQEASPADIAVDQIWRSKSSPKPASADDPFVDAVTAAAQRRADDTARRRAQLLGLPDPTEDAYTRAKRIMFPPKEPEPAPMPLNGDRVVNAVVAAMGGDGATVRSTTGDN